MVYNEKDIFSMRATNISTLSGILLFDMDGTLIKFHKCDYEILGKVSTSPSLSLSTGSGLNYFISDGENTT